MRRLGFPLGALALAAVVACTPVRTSGERGNRHPWTIPGHVRIGTDDEPDNLNPLFAHTDATDQVDALIFAPVFRYDAHGEFVPELVTEIPTYANGGISKDSKTIVLHWRRGVVWSDGAPLTARDLRFTWRAAMNPANNTKSTSGWEDVASIDVPRDDTAIVRLKRPNADVMGLFGGGGGSAYPPLPEHLLGRLPNLNRDAFNAHPISSGPFLLKAWRHGSSLEFVRNDRYWRGPPKVSAVSMVVVPNSDSLFTELQTHEIDVLDAVPEERLAQLPSIDGIVVHPRLVANFRRLVMNCSRPALSDRRVRLAIAEAIDWARMNATIFHGANIPARSDIPPNSWAAPNIPFYRYDPRDAHRLLDAAGWRLGPDALRARAGEPLRLTVSATNKPFNEQSEVQMQQQLRAIGIDLSIKNYPASYLFAQNGPLYTGKYDLEFSIDTNAPDPDNQGSWSGDFVPPKGANTTFLHDPIITATSEAAIRTFDRAKRRALYQREEERIHELVLAVFFYWENSRAAYNSDLRNYQPAEYITSNWNSWQWEI
ncbi:MAG: peptide ABC transporter substrate-binding protein [Candidatus Eremiobacteraeota bacterium]|nr:peptide ABC transporter substrate-binding protein [Candidatus Eremiobacteraeota bacterium]